MNRIKDFYKKVRLFLSGLRIYWQDLMFYIRNSNITYSNDTESKLQSTLTASYHIIEKGLTMPDRRLGFGTGVLMDLIWKCRFYIQNFGMESMQLQYALSVIKEYDDLHKANGFRLERDVQEAIDEILLGREVGPARQFEMTHEEFFADADAPFDRFSRSRHSTRHFDGPVSIDLVRKALALAQNAPSACNKQPMRAYVVDNKNVLKQILDLQQGNRGFGHLIDKVIVVTTRYCGCVRYSDRFYPFVDAGIYSMNLLYSLHFYKIGAIPLVWLSAHDRDNALRRLIGAGSDEVPCILIGIGNVADNAVCPSSPRKNIDEVVSVIM